MNVMMSTLHLVYPPVSSFEADFVKYDPEVEALLRTSDFYTMAMRPEVLFDHVKVSGAKWTFKLIGKGSGGKPLVDHVTLDVERLAIETLGAMPDTVWAEFGPKFVRLWPGSEEDVAAGTIDPFEWFTADKLLRDRGRGVRGITGLERLREFATYELLYVGIAKKADTFGRLFQKAHHARQRILSGEWPRRPGARVTDELILFPFRIEPTVMRTIELGDGLTETSRHEWAQYTKRVVADAEKAFIHLLDPQYNVEKFANYPHGADGLYGGEHQRYGYLIAENVTFKTANGTMRGSFNPSLGMFDDSADWIFVSGDEVELVGTAQDDAAN